MRRWLGVLSVLLAVGCAPSWKKLPHQTVYQKTRAPKLHEKPYTSWAVSDWWDFGLHSSVVPLAQSFSPARYAARLVGHKPALDVNAFGKVPDSPWYQNRITKKPFTAAELVRGPNRAGAPAPGPLVVVSGKTEGATPGLVLVDRKGARWFAKFDPPAFRGLSTSAELIASKFLYAAGYWVPETYVVELDVRRLQIGDRAWTRDSYERKIPLTEKALKELIALMNPDPRGRLRTLFSRAVPGEPIGPFSYRGVRANDPNDKIPHQRRRSLRGLWVLAAWLNNTDVRRQNTLDTFIPVAKGKGFVRHYLIDFGDSLGAAGEREKYKGEGYEARLDWSELGKRGVSLGFLYPYWLPLKRSPYRSVGIFEAKVFDPERWYPVVENPAFEEANPEDTFWGASVLARFTPELIRAGVETAGYTEDGATDFVVEVLTARRKKLLQYGFEKILALDDPKVEGRYLVTFVDLEVLGGLRPSPGFRYRVRWNRTGKSDVLVHHGQVESPRFDLREVVAKVMRRDRKGFENDPFLTLEVWRTDGGPRLELHLRAVRNFLLPVSLWREQRVVPARDLR
ncbi:MAG: hypothetical protein KJO07_18045 [Deltaproteobacteria bacterium]|nr:hypothetical protein [Deltaproteobacteria bacterium]